MSTTSERLNNAIVSAAMLVGRGSEAWALNDDWQQYYEGSFWRDLGPLGEAFTYGTERGFWQRYRRMWRRLPQAQRAKLPEPTTLEVKPVSDAAQAVVESNQSVARRATKAAQQGITEVKNVARDIGSGAAEGVQSTAYSVAVAAGALALLVYLARK